MRQSQSLVFQAGFPCRPEVPQDVQRISHNPNPRAEPASYAALSPDYNPSDVRTQSGDLNSASLPEFSPAYRVYSSVQGIFYRLSCFLRTCNGPVAGRNNRPATGSLYIALCRHDDDGSKVQSSDGRFVSLRLYDSLPLLLSENQTDIGKHARDGHPPRETDFFLGIF